MSFTQGLNNFFSELVGDGKRFKTNVDLARFCGVDPSYTHRLTKGITGKKNLEVFAGVLDKLGASLRSPGDHAPREVCFVDARIAQAGEGAQPPQSENYLAVPLVGEVGAGPGHIDQDEIVSWVLVYREHRSVNRRSNLLAVEVGKDQRSMIPTLHPGDIVLVDRNDWGYGEYAPPGNIFLVREPGQDGGGMVKRVATDGKGDLATITFYSDNAAEYGPKVYHMHQYDHDMKQAIVGKVVWAWADLSRK